jgi:4-amino-4-deoxy-L-arabinose transferase-like glycosyltransferase
MEYLSNGSALWEKPGVYFSGAPGMYPLLAANLDNLGGLFAVRLFSLIMVLVATVCVFLTSRFLFGDRTGVLSAFVFATTSSVIYVSHLAVFDATILMLLSLSVLIAIVGGKRKGLSLLSCGSLVALFTLMFFTKYASVAYAPIILLLAVAVGWSEFRFKVTIKALGVLAVTSGTIWGLWSLWGESLSNGLNITTVSRQVISQTSSLALLGEVLSLAGIGMLLAFVGAFLVRGYPRWLPLLLVLGGLAAPLQQIHLGESISLDKHLAYSMIFLAPLAGVALNWIWSKSGKLGIAVIGVLCVLLLVLGVSNSKGLLNTWADNSNLVTKLSLSFKINPTLTVLGEDPWAERYALLGSIDMTHLVSTAGLSDPVKAVAKGKFGLVYVSGKTPMGILVKAQLDSKTSVYHLVAKIPRPTSNDPNGYWYVYQHNAPVDVKS